MNPNSHRRPSRGLLALAIFGLLAAGGVALAQQHGHGGHGRMFERMDSNGDGAVSRAEAAAFRAERAAEMDGNGDGAVSFDEVKAWREAQRETRARERFQSMDTDGDGKVSVAEIAAAGEKRFDRMDRNDDDVIDADDRRGRRHGARAGKPDGG